MRIDKYLVTYKYADSRTKAEKYILDGAVLLDGQIILKPSYNVDETIGHNLEITKNDRYVSRGGLKLEGALRSFEVDVSGLKMVDIGSSTGGFTDCLLQNGAGSVLAVDSGRNQLHPRLRCDERVSLCEEYNARYINAKEVGMFDGAVMDVSFISQTLIIPALVGVIRDGGFIISLIKPQFESGKSSIGKGGIVKNPEARERAVKNVVSCAENCGMKCAGLVKSPITGGDGNIEYLGYFIKNAEYKAHDISYKKISRE